MGTKPGMNPASAVGARQNSSRLMNASQFLFCKLSKNAPFQ